LEDGGLTPERIDELLRFLPTLARPGRSWVDGAVGGGAAAAHFPRYHDDVLDFFMAAGQPWWTDFGYEPARAHAMLQDDDRVARADLDQIRTMLTYCVRSERFGDGSWLHLLEAGRVQALLRRLGELLRGMQAPS
jgi:hypothetical protein